MVWVGYIFTHEACALAVSKGNHLWEFCRDLLKNQLCCPKFIRWEESKDGVFRIVLSKRVSNMWGDKKNNPEMTYEKFSRAMRWVLYSVLSLPSIDLVGV